MTADDYLDELKKNASIPGKVIVTFAQLHILANKFYKEGVNDSKVMYS